MAKINKEINFPPYISLLQSQQPVLGWEELEDVSVGDPKVLDILLPAGEQGAAVSALPVLTPGLPMLRDVVMLKLQPEKIFRMPPSVYRLVKLPVMVSGIVRQKSYLPSSIVEILMTQKTFQQFLPRQFRLLSLTLILSFI